MSRDLQKKYKSSFAATVKEKKTRHYNIHCLFVIIK